MTKLDFLDGLKAFTENAVKELVMPVRPQKGDTEQQYSTAQVYKMRLPDSTQAQKKAPYIIHQIITSEDQQANGSLPTSYVTIRSIFCVYNEDEQEGALMLLNLMERFRIAILQTQVVSNRYLLDMTQKVETLVYPDDTAPFFVGEMKSVWRMPPVKREVTL